MADSLNLPPEVKPLWIEGLFTSEYERDTLPLLFATDKVFGDYYDALKEKNSSLAVAIDQIRERNTLARMERQEGMWMECVDSLLYCANLRKAIFAETDFQFTAAQKHHIMSLLNFATFFLRESNNAKVREAMLMRSYELFKKAEEAVAFVRNREDRYFIKTAVENNYSVYFAKRKKYCAASQRIQLALRAWNPLRLHEHRFYFAVQRHTGDLYSGRVDDAIVGLKQATLLISKKRLQALLSPARARGDHEVADPSISSDDDEVPTGEAAVAPFRYTIHVLNSGLDATAAAVIAVHHNLAIALIAQRRYREAVAWVSKCMELAAAQSTLLSPNHPIVVTIRRAEEFCQKMSVGTKMNAFLMKKDEYSAEKYRQLQAAAVREVKSGGHSGRSQQGTADGNVSPTPPRRGHSAQAPRFRKPSHVEALQTYLKNVSYRQLVEEYGFEDPRKAKHGKKSASTSPVKHRPATASDAGKAAPLIKASNKPTVSAPIAVPDASPARTSEGHKSPASSRSSSAKSSRRSSTASSPPPTPSPSPTPSPAKNRGNGAIDRAPELQGEPKISPSETPRKERNEEPPKAETSPAATPRKEPNPPVDEAPREEAPVAPTETPALETPRDATPAPAPAAGEGKEDYEASGFDSYAASPVKQPTEVTGLDASSAAAVDDSTFSPPPPANRTSPRDAESIAVATAPPPTELNATTYGNDTFDAYSEPGGSPAKADDARRAGGEDETQEADKTKDSTMLYSQDFETTAVSAANAPSPTSDGGMNYTTDFETTVASAAPPPQAPNDTTYGDDEFDE